MPKGTVQCRYSKSDYKIRPFISYGQSFSRNFYFDGSERKFKHTVEAAKFSRNFRFERKTFASKLKKKSHLNQFRLNLRTFPFTDNLFYKLYQLLCLQQKRNFVRLCMYLRSRGRPVQLTFTGQSHFSSVMSNTNLKHNKSAFTSQKKDKDRRKGIGRRC